MIFSSDNWAGAHPTISAALADAAAGQDPAYGSGDWDRRVADRFNEIFEREVAVYFAATGTAANALSMSACNRVGGAAFCHSEAHMTVDEFGALGFYTGGARTWPVAGALGRIDPQALDAAIVRFEHDLAPAGQPMAVTITQATEVGTVYALDEIATIADVCRRHRLPFHMDGARFANALVALDTTPADMTWRRGIDILSFGGTKNGCWMADAVVVFDLDLARDLGKLRHRAGQNFSKSRFIAAQFDAYLSDDVWLSSARHANAMASRLATMLGQSNRIRLAWEPQANEVFGIMQTALREELSSRGARFHAWGKPASFDGMIGDDETLCRFVTSFATSDDDIESFRKLLLASGS
ncbi:MAG: low specificity L-threonine aldolase [Mesorhizobium sp.]|nr:low specificity L-threonine aldolase [Mesorhizobium sp.]MCO5162515.1 low specificity L-threonine aldolase [Mesorhizobium sp.]